MRDRWNGIVGPSYRVRAVSAHTVGAEIGAAAVCGAGVLNPEAAAGAVIGTTPISQSCCCKDVWFLRTRSIDGGQSSGLLPVLVSRPDLVLSCNDPAVPAQVTRLMRQPLRGFS